MRTLGSDPTRLAILVPALLFIPTLQAQDEGAKTAVSVEQVQKLEQEYQSASQKWMAEYRAADRDTRRKLMSSRPQPTTWLPKFKAIVDAEPKSAAAAKAGIWMVRNGARGTDLERVLGILQTHHLDHDGLGTICAYLARNPAPAAEKFLRAVEKNSPHTDVRGLACLNLALCLKNQASTARALKTAEDKQLESFARYYGRQTVEVLKTANPDEIEKRAETCFAKVAETPEYAGVSTGRSSLLKVAEANLFEMRNLGIGRTAPEIDGEDIDGNPMKLSDYRGKVVVLDFWGDW